MFQRRSRLVVVMLMAPLSLLAYAQAQAQTAPYPDAKLELKAALVMTPEFCATKMAKGSWATVKETFEVGKIACAELEPAIGRVFSSVARVADPSSSGDAQVVLTPRFVDVAATTAKTAFSNREMDVFLEWTVKDMSGKTVWLDTVEGSAVHHMGNMFTYRKNLHLIVKDSVRDASEQSATRMASAPELRKLVH